jgi:hypothetical protein
MSSVFLIIFMTLSGREPATVIGPIDGFEICYKLADGINHSHEAGFAKCVQLPAPGAGNR